MRFAVAHVAIPALLLAACSADGGAPFDPDYRPHGTARELTVEERAVVGANTGFGLELLRNVAAEEEGNVLVSPLSVSIALGMVMNGAGGETWEQMRATLGFGTMSPTEINEGYRELLNQVRLRDPGVTLGVANSIWHDQRLTLAPAFVEQSLTYFDAEVAALDFTSAGAADAINEWVSDATGGRIDRLLDGISADEVAFLVNAVYFKADWSTRFDRDDTRAGTFHRADGSTVSAQFMSRHDPIARTWYDDAVVIELPYQDSAFAMLLVMPEEESVEEYLAAITPERWAELVAALSVSEIELHVPKFTFRMKSDLKSVLDAMGMPRAFTDAAEFPALVTGENNFYVSRVEHETFIKVDESGTEAAAATAVGIGVTSLPAALVFDRPFLAAIRERDTGAILFIGIVRDPTAD